MQGGHANHFKETISVLHLEHEWQAGEEYAREWERGNASTTKAEKLTDGTGGGERKRDARKDKKRGKASYNVSDTVSE